MSEIRIIRSVTQKGQVTIPAQIRRLLGIEAGDRVVFSVRDGQVIVSAVAETLRSAFGSLEALNRPEDFQALRDHAIEGKVARTREEMDSK